jgi:hypothetical protein
MYTAPEVRHMLIERWRAMSTAEKLAVVDAANRACDALAAVGVRRWHPEASDDEVRQRVIAIRLGRDLSRVVHGWDPDVEGW